MSDLSAGRQQLRIWSCRPIKTGFKNGRPWTLYAVEAANVFGGLIDDGELRSFTQLAGQVVVTVEVREGRFGTEYMLKGPVQPVSVRYEPRPDLQEIGETFDP